MSKITKISWTTEKTASSFKAKKTGSFSREQDFGLNIFPVSACGSGAVCLPSYMESLKNQRTGDDRMLSFLQFFSGYCRICVTGKGKERFLNLCKNRKLLLWNLRRREEQYEFCISYRAHTYIKEIGEKTNTSVRIEKVYGLPFFLSRHRKRKMFFIGFFLCILFIYVLSLFVWEIQVKGTIKYTEDEIKTYLKEQDISEGILKKKIHCAVLEEKIREDFEDTAWVSCDLKGTLLTIHIKESIDTSDLKEKNEVPNDIIASRDGIVESIITRSGTPLVKKGTQVKKGDPLISGTIYLYNEYDELLETSTVSADGDVRAVTEYTYEDHFPLQYYEKQTTGKHSKSYRFCLGTYGFPTLFRKPSYQDYDIIEETHFLKLGNSFYLPASVLVTTYEECKSNLISLTEEEAREKGEKKIAAYLEQLGKEGKEIQEKNFDLSIEQGECRIQGQITVVESIGKIRNIP